MMDSAEEQAKFEEEDYSDEEGESNDLEPLTEEEIEELIAELVEIESQMAEAQEALEEESLAKVEADVTKELSHSLFDDELQKAVAEEMSAFKQEWEAELDELETESVRLLEQLDGAGIELSTLYKFIEKQVPNVCCTESWKKTTHWVGTQLSQDASDSVARADEYLEIHRPVRRRYGKILEEGASGFLGKKIVTGANSILVNEDTDSDWDSFSKMCCEKSTLQDITFSSKHWASVYLASTPQQAAELGLKFAGVDEVEEIADVDGASIDPFTADAIANETVTSLTEEQKRNFRKVKEEDDANDDLEVRIRTKQSRFSPRCKEAELSSRVAPEKNELDIITNARELGERKKKIRRILDDAELTEETKKKIAIEKERQERLKSLEAEYSIESLKRNSMVNNGVSFDGAGIEMPGDTDSGYVINLVREESDVPVRIPPSISSKLKHHQIAGIRFMWENIIQSVRKVRSGDSGLGCILAHTMGLGKTFQVIAFLYTVMRSMDLGFKTALIVTPVSVQHNWRHEFLKWKPSELKPLPTFMLEDVPKEKRVEVLTKWRTKGGIFLIGYTAFRNLSLGKYVKDQDSAKQISDALQAGPDILVCDEAHTIKNTKADTTQALKQVKCRRRIALTGSPLQNNLMEYYCMVDFVREGFLGSSHEFRNRFQNPIENGQHTNSTAQDVKIMNQRSHILYEQLKGFVQRIDTSVVKKDLPPKTVFVIAVKLCPLQRKLYKKFLDVHRFTMDKAASDEKIFKTSFFAAYQTLARIWNHPGILQLSKENKGRVKCEDVEDCLANDSSSDENTDCNVISGEKLDNPHSKTEDVLPNEDWWRDLLEKNSYEEVDYSGKMVLLLDILRMCSDIGDKVLVFSQSLLTLDLIEFHLSKLPLSTKDEKCWKKGKDWYRLDGKTESSERQKLVERFNEPMNKRVKCVLISTRAGSLGINLPSANRVIIVDGSWNPTYDLQAIFRVWRYGQTKPVFAYRLMAHATMEEKIYKRQVTKEGLSARVVDRQQVHRTMSREEMLHLFEFGDDGKNADVIMHEVRREQVVTESSTLEQELPHHPGNIPSDKLMRDLISRHHPSWISNYHEHETLLQENEDEKLSKEEQDLAWEVYQKTLKWEEVQPVLTAGNCVQQQQQKKTSSSWRQPQMLVAKFPIDQKPVLSNVERARRNCTNLSHLLTLRSQGTKMGCSTVCGECDQEIRWEEIKK
ncbi:hypothetical protein ABFS83_06G174400 [Erythranthe nasuta]